MSEVTNITQYALVANVTYAVPSSLHPDNLGHVKDRVETVLGRWFNDDLTVDGGPVCNDRTRPYFYGALLHWTVLGGYDRTVKNGIPFYTIPVAVVIKAFSREQAEDFLSARFQGWHETDNLFTDLRINNN